jgi:hypothetical protein
MESCAAARQQACQGEPILRIQSFRRSAARHANRNLLEAQLCLFKFCASG